MRALAILFLGLMAVQPAGEIRLIVKGDDMGAGHGINVATIDAYTRGVLTTTNVIVPGPWFPEAAGLLRANPELDAGAPEVDVSGPNSLLRRPTLGPGLWLHIDHASTDDAEMRAFGHAGYEWVAADRSAVLEAWTSPNVREVIARRGIRLTNYRELGRGAAPGR